MAKNSITIANLPSDVDLTSFFDTFFGITGPPVIARLLRDNKNLKAVLMFETGEPFFLASFYNGATLHGHEIAVRQTTDIELESTFTDKSSKDIVVNVAPKNKKITSSVDGSGPKLKAEPKPPLQPQPTPAPSQSPDSASSSASSSALSSSSSSSASVVSAANDSSFEKEDLLALQTEMRTKGDYKPVQINQRNMIYKMLARYKGEFTVFRELVQNADDANATKVEINVFRDDANIIKRISVSNNGSVFTDSDWNRITKIASGNPNEYAVGCFGVGFYSVFSLTDSPAIRSGSKGLLIFWEGETLQCGFKDVQGPSSEWTSFIFALKDDQNQPRVYTEEFQVFLAQTLLFLRKVRSVRVIETRHNTQNLICEITRQQVVEEVNRKLGFSESPRKLFRISSISTQRMELRIELPNAKKSVFAFRVLQMPLDVTVPAEIALPIERIMQKKLPKQTSVSLLFELDNVDATSAVARSLSPYPDKGKLFIGSSTDQNTGCGFHLAAQLIPTIEREQLDFSDPNIRQWNAELITLAALAARFLYRNISEATTAELGSQLPKMIASLGFRKVPNISECSQKGFFALKSWPVKIPSSKGVLPSKECYLPRGGMEQFVQLPVVPFPIVSACERLTPDNNFFRVLLQQELISELTPDVFLKDLQSRPRTLSDSIAVLKWAIQDFRMPKQAKEKQNIPIAEIFSRLVIQDSPDAIVKLAETDMYTPAEFQLEPPYFAHPKSVPYLLSRSFSEDELQKVFNLTPINMLHVCQNVLNSPAGRNALCSSESAALMFLSLLSQKWNKLKQQSQEEIVRILRTLKCMPTRFRDLRFPAETFFRSVAFPENLPHISEDATNSVSPLVLRALGVKEKAPLALIFEHIRNASGGNLKLLLDLLVESEKEFTEEDWVFLRKEPFLPLQKNGASSATTTTTTTTITTTTSVSPQCVPAGQLYMPSQPLQTLGLPVLDLPVQSISMGLERILNLLGVQKHPNLEVLTSLMSKAQSDQQREAALMYMLNNIERYKNDYLNLLKGGAIPPILPTNKGTRSPAHCYSAPISNSQLLEYLDVAILHPALAPHRAQLGVAEHPPAMPIFEKILKRQPPLSIDLARDLFEYITDHYLSKADAATFRTTPFIPTISGNQSTKLRFLPPTQCLLPPSNSELAKTYKGLFEFIDFGAKANLFLRSVGVSDMPTPNQVANSLTEHHAKYFVEVGHETYLNILRQLAENISQIEPGVLQRMAQTPLCLCYEMVGEDKQSANLRHASEIYLVDNILYQRIFNPTVGPDVLVVSSLYERMGSRWLSTKVHEKVTQKGTPTRTALTDNFERLIAERKNLILFDSRSKLERKNLRPEAKDILNKLKFKQVPQIFSTLSLDKKQITTSGTICVDSSAPGTGLVFNVTADVRIDEIAAYLAQYLLKPVDADAELAISMLLSYDLDVLRKKGYPVDRLCNLAKPSDEKKRQVVLMKPQQAETAMAASQAASAGPASATAAAASTATQPSTPQSAPTTSAAQQPASTIGSSKPSAADSHAHNRASQPQTLPRAGLPSAAGGLASRLSNVGGGSIPAGPSGGIQGSGDVSGSFGRAMGLAREALSRGASGKPLDKLQVPESIAAIEKQCEVRSDANLQRTGDVGGLPFYEDPTLTDWRSKMLHLPALAVPFAHLLSTLANLYSIPLSNLRIFVEVKQRIAFNMGGQLFFNLCAFGEDENTQRIDRVHTWTNWYMVMAHELAHNVITEHGATHENVMRSICIHAFPAFFQHLNTIFDTTSLAAEIQHVPSSAPPASTTPGASIYPEALIQQLEEYGYARERILTALQLGGGDRDTALAILMSETDVQQKQPPKSSGTCYQQ